MNSKLRVLLIEDDPLSRWTTRKCIEKLGHLVSDAEDCSSAEALWQSNHYDLILSDYRLPDELCIALITRMRKLDYNEQVICMTAESEQISTSTQKELNITTVLAKPLDFQIISKAISQSTGCIERKITHTGKFKVIPCPPILSAGDLKQITSHLGNSDWIAFDMQNTECPSEDTLSILLWAAIEHRRNNGRFCIITSSDQLLNALRKRGLEREIDIASNIDALEPIGRRLLSICERSAILNTVVHDMETSA